MGHDHDHTHDHSHDHSQDHGRGPQGRDGGHPHGEGSSEVVCCSHHEIAIDRYIVLCLIGGVLVATTRLSRWFGTGDDLVTVLPAAIGAIVLAIPLFIAAFQEVKTQRLSSSSLAALAILASLANGDYEPAGWLAFILVLFGQLVRRSASGAERAIQDLVRLTPDTARLVNPDGSAATVALARVGVGQKVRILPGENFPVDGKVLLGRSTLNQASLTGEAAPVEVAVGDPVYAGTVNLTGALDVEVTQVGQDTTIGKVTQLIRQAEQSRTPRQMLIEQVSQFFVPVVLSVAAVVWFMMSQSTDPAVRDGAGSAAVTVLVVACPSALLLASPSAMLAAFAAAARLGILIKQPRFLEAAAQVSAVVMDKTGTITTGKFQVTKLAPATGVDGAELLRSAASGEQRSNHPLALSIIATGQAARVEVEPILEYEEIHGRGVRARTPSGEVRVGRASWLAEVNPEIRAELAQVEQKIDGMSGVHVMRDERYLGAVGLEDTVRPATRTVIQRLRDLGVRRIAIFTGDRLSVAKRVGAAVGVDTIEAECLPEEKHEQMRAMVRSGFRTMMVGDGINDGPSLAAADVGVAMGLSGSDIAANSAGVALMTDDLSRIPFLVELARRTRTIIAQNIAASIVIAIVGLVLAATGTLAAAGALAVPIAALYHFFGDVFVLANSFRLFRFGESFVAAEGPAEPAAPRRGASLRLGTA